MNKSYKDILKENKDQMADSEFSINQNDTLVRKPLYTYTGRSKDASWFKRGFKIKNPPELDRENAVRRLVRALKQGRPKS